MNARIAHADAPSRRVYRNTVPASRGNAAAARAFLDRFVEHPAVPAKAEAVVPTPDEDLAAGRSTFFADGDDLITALRKLHD